MRAASLSSSTAVRSTRTVENALLRHSEGLRQRLRIKLGRDGPDVDDLWQGLCFQALVKEGQLRGPPGPWLRRLADNLVREHIRRGRRRRTWSYDALGLLRVADAGQQERSASDVAGEIELARRLRKALARLPESSRTLLVAFYWGGRTYEELSRHLGISPRAVEGRLYRARRMLRERLGEK